METFTMPRELVDNSHFRQQKKKSLNGLTSDMIDAPIVELIQSFNKRQDCFTMQCCYGHFLYQGQRDPENLDALPAGETFTEVEYRIAYIALCIDNCVSGKRLIESLQNITLLDPENIQFGSADWFWQRQVNSYALQVEPDRFKDRDRVNVDYREALYLEKLRNKFFLRIGDSLEIN